MTSTDDLMDFFFQWHLTERCNLRCKHCYQHDTQTVEISRADASGIVDIASTTIREWSDAYQIDFSPSFNVSGGEPFLLPHLEHILRALRDKGFDIFLLTNGTLVNSDSARMLAEVPVQGVQVSIEGPETVHDRIRGRGSFSKAMKGVNALLAAGITVTMNITLSEINRSYVSALAALAESVGAERLGFSRLVPCGRGEDLFESVIPKEQLREVYREILSLRSDKVSVATGDPLVSQMTTESDGRDDCIPIGGCAAGVSGITILSDGTLTPCRRLPIPIGNILRDSLRKVWALSPVLEALRTKAAYSGKCSKCPRWSRCRGCRAIAYACSLCRGAGDLLCEDPQCFIDDAAFPDA